MEWAVGSPMPNLPPCWINCWSQGQVVFLMAVRISRFKVVFLKLWKYGALRVPWFVRNAQNGRGRRAWWWWTQALDSNRGWAVYYDSFSGSAIDLLHYVSSSLTTEWFGISVHYENDHQDKSIYHLSSYKFITILSTIFLTSYTSSLWLTCFVTGSWCLTLSLNLPTSLIFPSPSPLATTCLFSVFVSLFLFGYVFPFVFLFGLHI